MPRILAKRVSNYELFFDLAVVLGIGQLTATMEGASLTFETIFLFVLANVILLSLWINEVFYYNKYGDSRRIDVYTIIPLMFVLGNLALGFNFDLDQMTAGKPSVTVFNGLMVLAYGIIALQYYLKGRRLGFSKDIKESIVLNLLYAAVVLPFVLGLVGLTYWTSLLFTVPLVVPLFQLKRPIQTSLNFSHIIERLQLVTILTFGEAVIGIIKSFPLTHNLYQGPLLFAGMGLMFIFYMAQTFLAIDHHQQPRGTLLIYAHLPIFMGINSYTVGIRFLADSDHSQNGFYLMLAGILLFYLGTLSTTHYNQRIYQISRFNALVFLGILGLFSLFFFLFRGQLLALALVHILVAYSLQRYYFYIRRLARDRHKVPHPDPTQNLRDFS